MLKTGVNLQTGEVFQSQQPPMYECDLCLFQFAGFCSEQKNAGKLGVKVLFNFSCKCDKTNETLCYKHNFIV